MKPLRNLLVLLAALAIVIQVPMAVRADPTVSLTPSHGPPGTLVTVTGQGFSPGTAAEIEWWTMEGNRVSGSGYVPAEWLLGTATVDATGRLAFSFTAPSDLGGVTPHNVTVVVGGVVAAEAPFILDRAMTLTPDHGPEGTMIEFEMDGGGWTQVDNIVALTYDNAFIGYACSFTNQGHISVWLQAVGAEGTHLIGVYPALYSGPQSWDPKSNPEPFKHPALNTADIPTIYEPEFFTFEVTASTQSGRSRLGGAVDLHEATGTGDSLAITLVPASVVDDGQARIAVGNGAKGIVGGEIPYAIAGFPPNAHVVLRWDTRDGETKMGGDYNDKNLGWVFTETYATLGTVDVDAAGKASGALTIPDDFGGDHLLEAVVDDVVLADAPFKVVGRFTAALSEDGTQVILHGTGLGWEKYTAGYNVLYDGKAMGWITALTSRGTTNVAIPVVGEAGLHTVEVFGGQSGYPFLNKHETSWPWERVYRFAFTIVNAESAGPNPEPVLPLSTSVVLILLAAGGAFLLGTLRRRRPSSSHPLRETAPRESPQGKDEPGP